MADNNGYGLKVFAFMRIAGVPFVHQHIFDASKAPRGQLPYIDDDGDIIGDSETIIAHLIAKYALTIDAALDARQRDQNFLVTRLLDDLYWVMSYSRWKDDRYFPAFRDAFIQQHPSLTAAGLERRAITTRSAIISKASAATRLRRRMREVLPILPCWRGSCRQTAMCTVRRRPASTPVSMDLLPTFISSPSIRR